MNEVGTPSSYSGNDQVSKDQSEGPEGLPRISLVAYGHPSDPSTFSGYSANLALTLRRRGCLGGEFNIKKIRAFDAWSGAIVPGRKAAGGVGLKVSERWIWSKRGNQTLKNRVMSQILSECHRLPLLQIGTLVDLSEHQWGHYVLTDMTIKQATDAGQFAVSRMSRRAIGQAMSVQRAVLKGARHVFTLTDWAAQSVISDYDIAPEKVSTVYIGSNVVVPVKPVERNYKQVLFVGIDWVRKGGDLLLEGFKELRRRVPDAKLVIVGCDPGISVPGVEVLGYLSPRVPSNRERIANLFCESACFCMLSEFEPLGNVFVEAYACGTPVVALDRGSRSEIVNDQETGLLVRHRNATEVADAIYKIMTDRKRHEIMSAQCREAHAARFSWDLVVDRIKAVIGPCS